MEKRPQGILLKFPGTNCDEETARALRTVGFDADVVPFSLVDEELIDRANLLVLSGGFSYGDYVMAGRLAQLELQRRLGPALAAFKDRGGYLLGICNGFQILTRLGLLPEGSLTNNTNDRFICRWVGLEVVRPENPFLRGLPRQIELPIAHAEGRFVTDAEKAEDYLQRGLVTVTYTDNVNGSINAIAGLQDESGRVFGLMPHPERFLYREHHYDPDWDGDPEWGWGYFFFKSIHDHIVNESAALQSVPGG